MASKKEDMARGLDDLLEGKPAQPGKTEKTEKPEAGKARHGIQNPRAAGNARERLTERYAYASVALDRELYDKLREIGRRHALHNRDLLNAAMRLYLERYERKHGPVDLSGKDRETADSLI